MNDLSTTLHTLSAAEYMLATREARGWLADCGSSIAYRANDLYVWDRIARGYDGGLSAFLSDTRSIWEG